MPALYSYWNWMSMAGWADFPRLTLPRTHSPVDVSGVLKQFTKSSLSWWLCKNNKNIIFCILHHLAKALFIYPSQYYLFYSGECPVFHSTLPTTHFSTFAIIQICHVCSIYLLNLIPGCSESAAQWFCLLWSSLVTSMPPTGGLAPYEALNLHCVCHHSVALSL